jgi:hypothetical protein
MKTKLKKINFLGSVIAVAVIGFTSFVFASSNSASVSFEKPVDEVTTKWVVESILTPNGVTLEDPTKTYLSGKADLNNDGKIETFVFVFGRYFCGSGGCSGYLFSDEGKIISEFMVTRTPILVAESSTKGWQDLVVWSDGALRRLQHDGSTYPLNPSVAPKVDIEPLKEAAIKKIKASPEYQQGGYELTYQAPKELLAPLSVIDFTFKQKDKPDALYHAKVDTTKNTLLIEQTK